MHVYAVRPPSPLKSLIFKMEVIKRDYQSINKSDMADLFFLFILVLIPDLVTRIIIVTSFLYGYFRNQTMERNKEENVLTNGRNSPDSGFESLCDNDFRNSDDIDSSKKLLVADDNLQSSATKDEDSYHEEQRRKEIHIHNDSKQFFRSTFAKSLGNSETNSSIEESLVTYQEEANQQQKWPDDSGSQKFSNNSSRSSEDVSLVGRGEESQVTDSDMESLVTSQPRSRYRYQFTNSLIKEADCQEDPKSKLSMYQKEQIDLNARLNRTQFITKIEEMRDINLDIHHLLERGKKVIHSGVPTSLLYHQKEVNAELDKLSTKSMMLRSDLKVQALKCQNRKVTDLPGLRENIELLKRGKKLKSSIRELILTNKLHLERKSPKNISWPLFSGKDLPLLPTFLKEMDHCFDLVGVPIYERGKMLKDKTNGMARQILTLVSDNRNPSYEEIKVTLQKYFGNTDSMMEVVCTGHQDIGPINTDNRDNCTIHKIINKHMKFVKKSNNRPLKKLDRKKEFLKNWSF